MFYEYVDAEGRSIIENLIISGSNPKVVKGGRSFFRLFWMSFLKELD